MNCKYPSPQLNFVHNVLHKYLCKSHSGWVPSKLFAFQTKISHYSIGMEFSPQPVQMSNVHNFD